VSREKFVTEASIARKIANGFGRGYREGYTPWVRVAKGQLSSKGVSSIVQNATLGRAHHCLSLGELGLLLVQLRLRPWDAREQFPLSRHGGDHPLLASGIPVPTAQLLNLPRNRGTLDISRRLGVAHPRCNKTGAVLVLSTDLVVTTVQHSGTPGLFARAFKLSHQLRGKGAKRTVQKLEIERRYWAELNVPWELVTELDICTDLILNLGWLYSYADLSAAHRPNLIPVLPEFLLRVPHVCWEKPLRRCIAQVARAVQVDYEDGVALFRHALWRRLLAADLNRRIKLTKPLPSVRLAAAVNRLA
jgi:hypothetical protein